MQHLAQQHGFAPEWRGVDCIMCRQPIPQGKASVLRHLEGHLEEISLASLPIYAESDFGSESLGKDAENEGDTGTNPEWSNKWSTDPSESSKASHRDSSRHSSLTADTAELGQHHFLSRPSGQRSLIFEVPDKTTGVLVDGAAGHLFASSFNDRVSEPMPRETKEDFIRLGSAFQNIENHECTGDGMVEARGTPAEMAASQSPSAPHEITTQPQTASGPAESAHYDGDRYRSAEDAQGKEGRAIRGDTLGDVGIGGAAANLLRVLTEAASKL